MGGHGLFAQQQLKTVRVGSASFCIGAASRLKSRYLGSGFDSGGILYAAAISGQC
jgi:hypothetical protein